MTGSWRRIRFYTDCLLYRCTSLYQKFPEEFEDWLVNFQRFVIRLKEDSYMMGQIGNADETSVCFGMPLLTPITENGAKDMKLWSTGNKRSRFTVILACTAHCRKLPRFIIF
ncbi:hypothetical protein MTO96_006056 [Rhipicephalus appendiculatus]